MTPVPASPYARAGIVARWSARLLGVLLTLLFAVIVIGEWQAGMPGPGPAEMPMVAALIVSLAGFAIAWRSDAVGGALILVGFVAFEILDLMRGGRLAFGSVFPLIGAAGLLHLLAALARRAGGAR
jgi:hypothetical protein